MEKTVLIEKRIGQTPLEAIEEWRQANPQYAAVPLSYAGRLDPMASGALLVLIADECKNQKSYIGLDKEYEVDVLLGVGSDTGDVLGIVAGCSVATSPSDSTLNMALTHELGTHTLPYPVFSSKTVSGKPLFLYALEGTLDTIAIPTHKETIHAIELLERYTLSTPELAERIHALLALAPVSTEPSKALGADFRIAAVRTSWDQVFTVQRVYQVLRLRVSCTAGTYMRSLAGRIGKALGTEGLALSIHRTHIGSL